MINSHCMRLVVASRAWGIQEGYAAAAFCICHARRCRGRLVASTTTDATEILFTNIKGALAARRTRDRCTGRVTAAASSRPSAARLYR